ncbi:hypothetical protein PILCRDRAFT_521553 [Piloderma croceum F 1598]|uniref:Uncharacterized protein n=1 Tax=Piloderma croceum (strain F 1598) TaxID=765440 RepID=A0A0C3B3U9_PILCF|nr:hypothetical protein PILCRDRAFT_521553 [Piloderma croceum F 1598]
MIDFLNDKILRARKFTSCVQIKCEDQRISLATTNYATSFVTNAAGQPGQRGLTIAI